jgi:hypothetical protein
MKDFDVYTCSCILNWGVEQSQGSAFVICVSNFHTFGSVYCINTCVQWYDALRIMCADVYFYLAMLLIFFCIIFNMACPVQEVSVMIWVVFNVCV